jgi:hypothetical protein
MNHNLQINPVSCLSKRLLHLRRYVFDLSQNLSIFLYVKIQLFVTF